MNSLRDCLDNSLDARPLGRIDILRIAHLEATRALVWSRLDELNQEVVGHYDVTITVPQGGAMSSTAFDNLRNATSTYDPCGLATETWPTYAVEIVPAAPGPDPFLVEERKALRRLLRFLNKVITIALRRQAFHDSLRQLVLRLRAFFVTHGNHPPRDPLRHLLMPEGGAV